MEDQGVEVPGGGSSVKDLAKKLELSGVFACASASESNNPAAMSKAPIIASTDMQENKKKLERLFVRKMTPEAPMINVKPVPVNRAPPVPAIPESIPLACRIRVDGSRASQSLDHLAKVLKEGLEVHRAQQAKLGAKGTFRRGAFLKSGSDLPALNRAELFWNKLKGIIECGYPKQTTMATMLGTALISLVECRQAYLDIVEIGVKSGQSPKSIAKSPSAANLLDAIVKLESELDDVFFFSARRIASDCKSASTIQAGAGQAPREQVHGVEFEDADDRVDVKLPVTVDSVLFFLKERLKYFEDDLKNCIANLQKVDRLCRSYHVQGYDAITVLLFVADTAGKLAMESCIDSEQKKSSYLILSQVFSLARANALCQVREWVALEEAS